MGLLRSTLEFKWLKEGLHEVNFEVRLVWQKEASYVKTQERSRGHSEGKALKRSELDVLKATWLVLWEVAERSETCQVGKQGLDYGGCLFYLTTGFNLDTTGNQWKF